MIRFDTPLRLQFLEYYNTTDDLLYGNIEDEYVYWLENIICGKE